MATGTVKWFNPAKGYETSRWIDLGIFSFQPSEIIRLILPLSIVAFLFRKEVKPYLSDWIIATLAALLCFYLVYKQPDLGTAIIVFTSGLIPIFLAGIPYRIILGYLNGLYLLGAFGSAARSADSE